ncbi:MAG: type II secretion system protein N [Nevskiales bacterium]
MKLLTLPTGIIVFLGMLFWTLPPHKALSWWGDDLQPSLQLVAATGSTGRGSASMAFIDQLKIDEPQWQWRLSALLKGRLGFDISGYIDGHPAALLLEFGLGNSVHIHDFKARVPAQSLLPLLSGMNLPVGGFLEAQIEYLHIKNNRPRAIQGNAQLKQAAWRLMRPPLELGSVDVELSTEDEQISGTVINQPGSAVELEGQLSVNEQGQYQFNARLKALPGADPRLTGLMQGLGQKDSQGWYSVKTQGSL